MAARLLITSRSAMPKRMKRNVLTQEAIRILRNCSEDLPWERVSEILSDFCLRMQISGYNEQYRYSIIRSALTAWEKQKTLNVQGIRPMYRTKEWNKDERILAKEKKSTQWFRRGNNDCDFPIFCPFTPGSILLEKWKRVAEDVRKSSKNKVKPKIIELGGTTLRSLLCKSAPKEEEQCEAEDCNVCTSNNSKNNNLKCRKITNGGLGYQAQCKECQKEGKTSIYHGETSRPLYTRAKEHLQQAQRGDSNDKPLLKHANTFHPGKEPNFEITVNKFFMDPLSRQIDEGVRINNSESDNGLLMNSKSEFHQGAVPRVVMMRGIQT